MDKIEATLMAEGLHPLDIVWLEKRVEVLGARLRKALGLVALSEGDASGG